MRAYFVIISVLFLNSCSIVPEMDLAVLCEDHCVSLGKNYVSYSTEAGCVCSKDDRK
jgi:hypothetical protein